MQLDISLLVAIANWIWLRRAADARFVGAGLTLLAIDAMPVGVLWAWLLCLSARPLLVAFIITTLTLTLVIGNEAKRKSSGEDLVFTDWLLCGIVFYPKLYAEFITPCTLVTCSLFASCVFVIAGFVESPIWVSRWPGLAGTFALLVAWRLRPDVSTFIRFVGGPPIILYSHDPKVSLTKLGPLAGFIVQTAIAQHERCARQTAHSPNFSPRLTIDQRQGAPIVVMQIESFFDARRLGNIVPSTLLREFDRCLARSRYYGRLDTPAYGANTLRTEFSALTGLSGTHLGLDRFHPYGYFARKPINSLAWHLRQAGYMCVCIHPFYGTFYGRNKVMSNLGFDQFLDIESFPKRHRSGHYISDAEVANKIAAVLHQHGPRTFVFAITISNHSPWKRTGVVTRGPPQSEAFSGYLDGLRDTDEALGLIADTMSAHYPNGLFAAFGDHQPNFEDLYRYFGHEDPSTDYFILRDGLVGRERRDIAVHELPGMILSASYDDESLDRRMLPANIRGTACRGLARGRSVDQHAGVRPR